MTIRNLFKRRTWYFILRLDGEVFIETHGLTHKAARDHMRSNAVVIPGSYNEEREIGRDD